jgi:hypothetical protein
MVERVFSVEGDIDGHALLAKTGRDGLGKLDLIVDH